MSPFLRMTAAAVSAFAGSCFFTAVYIRTANKFVCSSGYRIPSGAGIVFGTCSLAAAAVFRYGGENAFLLPAAFILLSGILDDVFEFSVLFKMLVHTAAVALLVHNGLYLHTGILSGAPDGLFTFVWVTGITNAFNYLDIVDGLAASAGIVSAAALFILFIACGDMPRAAVYLFLCLALSGFFFSNYPPAKAYMGNTGSHFIGFMLSLAPLSSVSAPAACPDMKLLAAVLLITGLPVFDTAFVTLLRFSRHQPLFKKSGDHLALCLIRQEVPLNVILRKMTAASGLFCLSGLLVCFSPWRMVFMITLLPALFICVRLAMQAVKAGR